MKKLSTYRLACLAIATLVITSNAGAHMPWLATDADGRAMMWFGESPDERTYPMPASVRAMKLAGGKTDVATGAVDSDSLVGIQSEQPVGQDHELSGTVTYGLYHGTKLTYHVEHLPMQDPAMWPTEPRDGAAMQSVLTRTDDGGLRAVILRDGKPVVGTEVKLFCEDGHEEGAETTDDSGTVTFAKRSVEDGLGGIIVGVTSENEPGTLDGKDYQSTTHYLTATFFIPSDSKTSDAKTSDAKAGGTSKSNQVKMDPTSNVSIVPSELAELPEELTSFGGAIAGGKLYVYGGHTGSAHSYSTEEQSDRLWSLDLAKPEATWVELAGGPSLQGLALVAYQDDVIRIGGFTAVNEADEDQDLRSQASVARFDAETKTWTDLAPLPEPRSSLDAAVLGDRVYVFGGWKLAGSSDESHWHTTAWSLDLSQSDAVWQPIATPPFERRAISVAAHEGKLFVIGGMNSTGKPTTRVDVYDPAVDQWNEGPALPGSGMSGFGSSSFATGGKLYVSTMDGFVHRLGEDQAGWSTVAKTDPARFFHRMLPATDDALLMVGGANMEIGKFTQIDRIKVR